MLIIILTCAYACQNSVQTKEKKFDYSANIPSDFLIGYSEADYNVYNTPAKVNGLKYDKIYLKGRIINEFTEKKDIINCDFIDNNDNIWLLKLDKTRSANYDLYKSIIEQGICLAGIYAGTETSTGKPVIYVNKLLLLNDYKEIDSKYYFDYYGEFDENGRVITSDFDDKDNTNIDFHSIHIDVPYNYKEAILNNNECTYIVYDDSLVNVRYFPRDYNFMLSDYPKRHDFIEDLVKDEKIKEYFNNFGKININNVNENIYEGTIAFDFDNKTLFGKGMVYVKSNGLYAISLLTKLECKYNRGKDFQKIQKSIRELEPPKPVNSFGVNKLVLEENKKNLLDEFFNIKNIEDDEIEIDDNNNIVEKVKYDLPSYDNYKSFVYTVFDKYYKKEYLFSGDKSDWNIVNQDLKDYTRSKLSGKVFENNTWINFNIIIEFTDNTNENYIVKLFEAGNEKFVNDEDSTEIVKNFAKKENSETERRVKDSENNESVKKIIEENRIKILRKDWVEKQFSGWDGSNYKLNALIKEKLNDEASFKHINTRFIDIYDDEMLNKVKRSLIDLGYNVQGINKYDILVQTEFSAKNAFNATVKNYGIGLIKYDAGDVKLIDIRVDNIM